MPFIGNQPALAYTSFAKQDFTTSATTSYTLDNPVTNANELALFINFVRQEAGTAYSASGTTLTLTEATSATDDMYCVFLGKAVQTVNPPNASVGASQIVDSSIALGKLSATGTKDATTFLRGDNTFDTPPLGGITEADMYRLTSGFNSNQDPISSNLERVDDATFGKLGTGVTPSSGIFSFATTGLYLVKAILKGNTYDAAYYINIYGTADNSSYDRLAYGFGGNHYSDTDFFVTSIETFFNCTNVSTHKIKFTTSSMTGSGSTQVFADTDANATCFQFIRLGDSV